jgi:hypothetical protein
MTRAPAALLGAGSPVRASHERETVICPAARSTSDQRSARSSPCRRPANRAVAHRARSEAGSASSRRVASDTSAMRSLPPRRGGRRRPTVGIVGIAPLVQIGVRVDRPHRVDRVLDRGRALAALVHLGHEPLHLAARDFAQPDVAERRKNVAVERSPVAADRGRRESVAGPIARTARLGEREELGCGLAQRILAGADRAPSSRLLRCAAIHRLASGSVPNVARIFFPSLGEDRRLERGTARAGIACAAGTVADADA